MRKLLDRYLMPMRAPEDGGAPGGGEPAGGSPAASGEPPAPAADPGGASAAPGQPVTPPPVTPDPYRPDGLAENYHGKDDRETIDKLNQAVKGYRDRDASRQVPENFEGYRDFTGVELPETLRPHIESLSNDPIFDAAGKEALKHGVGRQAMQAITTAVYSAAAESGMLEPPVDVAAERQQLLPEGYTAAPKAEQDRAINARLQANEDFVKLQVTNGKMSQADGDHVLGMLMDTAAGNRFLEYFRSVTTGDSPQPAAGGGTGGDDRGKALKAELAALEKTKGTPAWDRGKYDALMSEYRSHYGE